MSRPSYLTDTAIADFIQSALREDLGEGDHTSLGAVPSEMKSRARLLVKEEGIIAGIELAKKIFQYHDPELFVSLLIHDGHQVKPGEIAFIVEGNARSILATERLVLNCMQRMSGIASYTHRLNNLIRHTRCQLMDTRKTTPNFRMMEKWAVAIGGGRNHRLGLYDMIMLKDNHVDLAGGIEKAILSTRRYLSAMHKKLEIEIETRTIEEVMQVLRTGGVDVIMLDNMSLDRMKEAVLLIGGKYKTEASGGITEATLKEVAECGVDFISIGALTHSFKSLDLSLKVMD
jgi:nicotinate-nucleotide pyrophosphorylase (carboxylating)